MRTQTAALPYREPDIVTILILTSLLLLLNTVNHIIDTLLYCGLIGQIFLGVAWGTPGGHFLSPSAEQLIVQLGYLGLLLLVYEGGLSTNFAALKANAAISICAAFTGIAMPIALSYALVGLVDASPLQAFAAGAALCSTSLGTTFTVLKTTGLAETRLGVVLSSAAILDDVVGLVMVQVIQMLGENAAAFTAATVVRPVFVALAFAIIIPLGALFVVKPLTIRLNAYREKHATSAASRMLRSQEASLVMHTAILIGMVAATSFAGTSNLLAAWIAGAVISWWDVSVPHMQTQTPTDQAAHAQVQHKAESTTGEQVFAKYYEPTLARILKPFFFASIGFSIPISQMFQGEIVWKGLVYTLLMVFGKLVCGLWLVRLPARNTSSSKATMSVRPPTLLKLLLRKTGCISSERPAGVSEASSSRGTTTTRTGQAEDEVVQKPADAHPAKTATQAEIESSLDTSDPSAQAAGASALPPRPAQESSAPPAPRARHAASAGRAPLSLYPSAIFGTAMVARGEVGFLISSVAQSSGIFSNSTFLVVTWAIMLCTIGGPLAVGTLVKRVKALQRRKGKRGERDGALGQWGVD